MRNAGVAAAVAIAMDVAGGIGDMWAQTNKQACNKGLQGERAREGQRACAAHAATYVLTQAIGLLAVNQALNLRLRPGRAALGLALSGLTHYAIDRREPLKRVAHRLGKGEFYDMVSPICGAFEMDQSAHRALNAMAAVVISAR